jgi:hypothetical protein
MTLIVANSYAANVDDPTHLLQVTEYQWDQALELKPSQFGQRPYDAQLYTGVAPILGAIEIDAYEDATESF